MRAARARRRVAIRAASATLAASLTLAVLLALSLSPAASGSHPDAGGNWPEALPPRDGIRQGAARLAFDVCPRGRLACPRRVIREMRRRWRPLDRRCDHRAVFALTYLRTTQEFFRTIRRDPNFFRGRRWINHEDTVFARLYFRPYDRWERGGRVPAAWRIAFEASESPDLTAIGDLLLGMNAHINRDLSYTLAHVGLADRQGRSRKRDHDRVNEFLDRVVDPLQAELARRYDPMFELTDAGPSPLDELGALHAVRGFRENAWRNAERLLAARDPAEQRSVRESIESQAEAMAHAIVASNTVPGYGATRDAHCRS